MEGMSAINPLSDLCFFFSSNVLQKEHMEADFFLGHASNIRSSGKAWNLSE